MFKKGQIITTTQYPHSKYKWKIHGFTKGWSNGVGYYQILCCKEITGNFKHWVNLLEFHCKPYNKEEENKNEKLKQTALKFIKEGKKDLGLKILKRIKNEKR